MKIKNFFQDKKVFITGHTGFKGSWLCIWLKRMGAEVTGYALEPPTSPSLFEIGGISDLISSIHGDVRDSSKLLQAMQKASPDIVIHMAAQPLVRDSYRLPVETYEINVMGTVNLLEAARQTGSVKAVINVTTDKVYENREWIWGYRENEPLGGYDPYSSSKACSELVTAAYRNSYFNPDSYDDHGVALATVRAGNVIGGGDWASDRLIPDCLTALFNNQEIVIRSPQSIRPWQHVLEPLYGYLLLAQRLYSEDVSCACGWNFGPPESDAKTVEWIVDRMCRLVPGNCGYTIDHGQHPHEANYLKLDCSKAHNELGWQPQWSLNKSLEKIIKWYQLYIDNKNMYDVCSQQIEQYIHGVDDAGNTTNRGA
ncbi:CDP-glucose 4,6-dehydratase [Desulfobacterota bacterium M19]